MTRRRYLRLRAHGRSGEAEELLRQYLASHQTKQDAWYTLVNYLIGAGRFDDAATAAEQWYAACPDSVGAWGELAEGYLHAGRLDEANAFAAERLARAPDDPEAKAILAHVLLKREDRDAARSILRSIELGDRTWAHTCAYVGTLFARFPELRDKAIVAFNQASQQGNAADALMSDLALVVLYEGKDEGLRLTHMNKARKNPRFDETTEEPLASLRELFAAG